MVEGDLVTELATKTAIYCGRVAGGLELTPGRAVQVMPQDGGVALGRSAYPLKLADASPPLRAFNEDHCALQKVTFPEWTWSPITKEPPLREANSYAKIAVVAKLGPCAVSPG